MNTEARTRLEELLATEPSSLTAPDIEFLRARSSYLSEEQKRMLKQFDTAKKEEANEDAEEAVNYSSRNKAELQDLLRERNIEFEDSAKKEDLITLLEDSDLKK